MFCKNCGTQIDDNAAFCPNCGTKNDAPAASAPEAPQAPAPEAPQAPAYEAPAEPAYEAPTAPEAAPEAAPKKKGFKKWMLAIIIPAAVVLLAVIILVIALVAGGSAKNALQADLMEGEWIRADDEGVLILELDFGKEEIVYSASGVYVDLNETIATIPYEVVDEDTIYLSDFDREIDVTVETDPEDGTRTLTCTPAMTSTDTIEWWFQFED